MMSLQGAPQNTSELGTCTAQKAKRRKRRMPLSLPRAVWVQYVKCIQTLVTAVILSHGHVGNVFVHVCSILFHCHSGSKLGDH